MKASKLDPDMLPPKQIIHAYQSVGKEYEITVHDRAWQEFHSKVVGNEVIRNQEIDQKITTLYRVKDNNGEWLFYYVLLEGRDWQDNAVNFYHTEGIIENIPIWEFRKNPQTLKVDPQLTQVRGQRKIYTISFSSEKVEELSKYFTESVQFHVIGLDTRRYTCDRREFTDMSYNELIDLKTGFAEYQRNRQRGQLKEGGVK